MGLIIKFKPIEIELLSDIWIDKEQFDELENKIEDICGLFEEDLLQFVEDCGGLENIISEVKWKNKKSPPKTTKKSAKKIKT